MTWTGKFGSEHQDFPIIMRDSWFSERMDFWSESCSHVDEANTPRLLRMMGLKRKIVYVVFEFCENRDLGKNDDFKENTNPVIPAEVLASKLSRWRINWAASSYATWLISGSSRLFSGIICEQKMTLSTLITVTLGARSKFSGRAN